MDNYSNFQIYDKYQEDDILSDMADEGVSNCCGASVIMNICMDCHEGCGIEE